MTRPLTRPLIMREATEANLGDVVDLLMGARHWLAERGLHPEWPRSFTVESTLDRIHDHQVFLAWHGTTPVGTITVDYQPDPDFWLDAADDAGYVYRLAVDRAHAGQHIGAFLLDWAGDQIARTGRRWLRLDCVKDNPTLHAYYRALGFDHLRTVDLPHRTSGALFQRPARQPATRPAAHR